ncbi:MAG: sugar ABC transporter permease [Mobiluncus porci]|uniref:carbohydrate ABC transporter permease n=1 Tax=Mobiluncus porci TaxID=2652278 RepID=UPI0023EFCC20|nr:sugar ABC transporter permease [Mobiluncus porci]MDD7541276.1 sugar ABC transporter permease [Mobiluncus porci]MDY5749484.1 sugar ABC transporter permease [Mobiluncus porci]
MATETALDKRERAKSPRKKARSSNGFKQWGPGLLLVSPSLILVAIFVYGLLGSNVYTSLQDNHTAPQISGAQPVKFVGFDNFAALFASADFQHSLVNLLMFTVLFLLGTLILGFIWAWLLDKPLKGEGIFRSVFLFPMAVSFIASGVVWRWLLNSAQDENASGLNRLLQMIGFGFLQNDWISNAKFGVLAIAIPAIWQLSGYVMALFLAGFRGIPDDLREAGRVDGANEFQLYRYIIFPQLAPVALSAIIIIGHMSLKSFDLIMAVADQTFYQTKVPAIDMYNFMTVSDYSNAAAVGTVLLVIVAVLVVPYLIHDAKEGAR